MTFGAAWHLDKSTASLEFVFLMNFGSAWILMLSFESKFLVAGHASQVSSSR